MKQPVDNKQLRVILRDYLSSENPEKYLVILSRPFSGRTQTVEAVMKEVGCRKSDIIIEHLYTCPPTYQKSYQNGYGSVLNFDQWMDQQTKPFADKYKYGIFEVDPNQFFELTQNALFGDGVLGYKNLGVDYTQFLVSEKYELIPYFPTVSDWIEWAENKDEKETWNLIVEFAKAYPEYYYLYSYSVYVDLFLRLEGTVNPFLGRKEGKCFTNDDVKSNCKKLLFTRGIHEPYKESLLAKDYIDFLKMTEYRYLVEVTESNDRE